MITINARAVGEGYAWDLYAELVVAVEDLEGALAFPDQAVAMDEHAVDVEGEGEVFGNLIGVAAYILDLDG